MRQTTGYTLLELLITVAIIGIIAAVALPTYQQSVLRSARAEAKSALMQVAANQERFYSANNSYSTNADPLSASPQATVESRDGSYVVSVAACTSGSIANCFLATAVPQDNQSADSCGSLTLTNTGVRAATGGSVDDCWER
ncbi:MAG: type IV pilin protein [Pseudohongiellaceae bacterium]